MKTFFAALAAVIVSTPALATSLRHPYDFSVEELNAVLSHKQVVAKLTPKFEGLKSAERTRFGWELKTDHCRLEVAVNYVSKPITPARPLPFPQTTTERVISVGDCR